MINFKEYEGKLFRMLEEHEIVPLKEKDTNVLVRFITQGIIGEYVMEHWLDCNQKNVPIYVKDVDSDGDVTVCIENGNEHICCPFPMFQIIGTFVEEGSEDWAWYQMMKGEKVRYAGSTSQRFYAIKKGCDYCAYYENDGNEVRISTKRTYDEFMEYSKLCAPFWEIYTEPKPLLADAKEGWLVTNRAGHTSTIKYVDNNNGVLKYAYEVSDGTTIYVRENGMFNIINHNSNYDIIHTEPIAPEGTAEWELQMMLLGKNESENIIHGHIPADIDLKYFHLDEFKVGDWVEFIDAGGHKSQGKYLSKAYDNAILVLDITYNMRYVVPTAKIIRKLSPSEVIVKIGCLRGTVERHYRNPKYWFKLRSSEYHYALISIEMLDAPTRERVEGLIKAQEKG